MSQERSGFALILGTTDMELLRLAGWCKNLPSDMYKRFGARVFHPKVVKQMEELGLMGTTSNHACIRLRPKGWRLLRYVGCGYHEDAGYRSDYERRLEVSRILLTFYRAGYDVFAQELGALSATQVFLQSPVARRDSSPAGDLLGGSAFYGIACIRNYICSCYFVTGNETASLHHRNERMMLDKAASRWNRKEALIFAGSDYLRTARVLRNVKPDKNWDNEAQFSYAGIYQDTPYPLHLLECSDAGALQLLIMAQEQYRRRLGAVIAHAEPKPPVGVRDADGEVVLRGEEHLSPWLLAVDMDVKRIDRALRQSVSAGYQRLVLLCLEEQKKALQYLYAKESRAMVATLSHEHLAAAFGKLALYEPKPGAYLDREGGVLDATNLPVD